MEIVENFFLKGRVVSLKANFLEVEISLNEDSNQPFQKNVLSPIRLLCTKRRRLLHNGESIFVGDYVVLEAIDLNNKKAVIKEVLPRFSIISRPQVANVSNVFVVTSLFEPSFDLDQASRFLLTAEQVGVKITLVLTKTDLVSSITLNTYNQRLAKWGYTSLPISVKENINLDLFFDKLRSSRLSVLCGPSGVGKSSLINAVLPGKSLKTAEVSGKLKRGRHTTSNVELFSLGNDSYVADTPGFNRPELNIEPKLLPFLFPELRGQLNQKTCKFRNCRHLDDPGCQVIKTWERYSQYKELMNKF